MANLKKLKRKKRMPEGGTIGVKNDKLRSGYPVGTPLRDIYNLDTNMSEQAQLMATQPLKNRINQVRDANFKGYWTDYSEGQSVPSLQYTPAVLEDMEKRGLTREYIDSWQPSNYPKEFGVGGDVAKGALSGAGTGFMIGGPWGAAAGAVVGGVAGWLGGGNEEDEIAEDYIVPQGLASQHYQRAAGGGDLTEFTGERHENGGIALGGLPVEVEGGETRTNDMIHSDRIKITSDMIKKYPALKKSDKGKTMAQITKREHKKFEKREFDELNDNAAEITMMPFEEISDELSQSDGRVLAYGGDLNEDPKLPKGYKGVTTEGIPYGEFRDFPIRGLFNKDDSRTSGLQAVGKKQYADNKIELANMIEDRNPESKRIPKFRQDAENIYDYLKTRPRMGNKYVDVDAISYADGGDISATKAREILSHGIIRGKPITAKQSRFFGAKSKAAGGFNLQNVGKYAPLITSGIDTIGALIDGPEEVDYGRTSFTPAKVNYASAEPGVQRIRRTFGNAESKLRRYNPNRYMARMGDLAARESDAVTGEAGRVQGINTQAGNRANLLDAQNATRVNMFNKQVSIQEANANAANRGAQQSRISGNLANMGTMAGQMSRDERQEAAQAAAQDRYFNILEDQNRMMGWENPLNQPEEDIFTNVDPLGATPNYPGFAYGGNLTHRLRLRNYKTT